MSIPQKPPNIRFTGLVRGYKAVALIVLNTLVLFVLLNLVCWAGLKIHRPAPEDGGFRKVPDSLNSELYPSLSESQLKQHFSELKKLRYVFEPFTHFRNKDCSGQYVNIRNGVRHLEEGSWPPRKDEITVFVFGGSTTFGCTPDPGTIPAYLQGFLREFRRDVTVYNFGRIYYYSTQERVLFEQLLMAGIVPRVAVFIDGLNDFNHTGMEVPQLERFKQVFEGSPRWPSIPVVKAVRALMGQDRAPQDTFDQSPEALKSVIDRYLANKRLIEAAAGAYGVTPVFVWQPVPTYKMESPHYPFRQEDIGRAICSKMGYPMMEETVARTDMGGSFLWLADLQLGHKEPIYVDQVHYSQPFSRVIAAAISKFLIERKVVPPGKPK